MTIEQIEMELIHNYIDYEEKNGKKEAYEDDSFGDYDKETEEKDSRVTSIQDYLTTETLPPVVEKPIPTSQFKDEDWEDIDE